GGQQQRIAIARALVNRPPVLFADEPTGNLDSKTTVEVLAMLQSLNIQDGLTIIIVTHDPIVAAHTKRDIPLHAGHVESDTTQQAQLAAKAQPAHPAGVNHQAPPPPPTNVAIAGGAP